MYLIGYLKSRDWRGAYLAFCYALSPLWLKEVNYLLYNTTTYIQPITVGMDIGFRTASVSAVTKKKEVFSAEIELRADIKGLLFKPKAAVHEDVDKK